jgi:branched-chain amino acid transport system permease protein
LAIVLVNRATGVLNFAQGQLATLSAFVCWSLTDHGWAFWPAFAVTVGLSFAVGLAVQMLLVAPVRTGPLSGVVLLTVGLLLAIDGLDTWLWGSGTKRLASPFSAATVTVAGAAVSRRELGTIVVTGASMLLVAILLARTKLGLGLRAIAVKPLGARQAGVPVSALLGVAWGLAAAIGAVAGVLAAQSQGLEPGVLQTATLYAFAASALGGLESPLGAALGGVAVGLGFEFAGAYVDGFDGNVQITTAVVLILVFLVVRPRGLLGRRQASPT